jgi:hypothetical protein
VRALGKIREALRRGVRDTRTLLGGRPAALGHQVLAVLAAAAAILLEVLRGVWAAIAAVAAALSPHAKRLRGAALSVSRRASAVLTPVRALAAAAIGCAVMLGLSEFADYRGVAIGAGGYEGLGGVAPAPEVAREENGSAHSYLLVPASAVAILALVLAVRSRRWQLCRIAVLVGVVAIAVSFLVDRPAGLDEGPLARDFAGAEARLLEGFWAQVAAGAGLAITSTLLAVRLRAARAGHSRPRSRRESRMTAGPPATAGGGA